ncbi:MAG: isochorismatase, partial [Pseudomonadota bacterium]
MLLDADDCQLVLVDYQSRLMPVIFENDIVAANAVRLAQMARIMQLPVWASAQLPDKLGTTLPAVQAAIDTAGGKTLIKAHFSAAAEGLTDWLRPPARKPAAAPSRGGNARSLPKHLQRAAPEPEAEEGRNTIVIAGCEAHVCLLQT